MFEDLITNAGLGDNMLIDGIVINYLNIHAEADFDYGRFVTTLAEAIVNDSTILTGAAKEEFDDLVDTLEIDTLADNYGWAWDNRGAIFNELLNQLRDAAPWNKDAVEAVGDASESITPLVLDLDGDGIELTDVNGPNAVYWDIDQDGFKEASAWVGPDDGLLALDQNGDGVINDHGELFGNDASISAGFNADGYIKLSQLDTNNDDVIDSQDAQFGDLLVWIDANTDGISQSDELNTLADLNIASLDLNYSSSSIGSIEGNEVPYESTYTLTDNTTHLMVDALFEYDDANSVYAQEYALDIRTLFLPTLRGYGDVPDLHIAMSLDETLLTMVQNVAAADTATLFDPTFDLEGQIKDILFRWAGIEDVDQFEHGPYVDVREQLFLEAVTASEFDNNGSNVPEIWQALVLKNGFDDAYDALSTRIVAQSTGDDLFTQVATYNSLTDTFDGAFALDLNAVDTTITGLNLSGDDLEHAWNNMIRLVDNTVGVNNLSAADQTALDTSITNSDTSGTLSLQYILDTLAPPIGGFQDGTSNDDTFTGGVGNDYFWGRDGSDTAYGGRANDGLQGWEGNDFLYGEDGEDVLQGGAGDDYLAGGAGNDVLIGGAGDDTFFYESGVDVISSDEWVWANPTNLGSDTILFASHISLSQITMTTGQNDFGPNYASIYVDGELAIRIENYFSTTGGPVETLEFSNGDTVDLSATTGIVEGTAGDDDLTNIDIGLLQTNEIHGLAGNDTLDGGAGDDTLRGGEGSDTYLYHSGNDIIYEQSGTNDTIILSDNITANDVTVLNANNSDTLIRIDTGTTSGNILIRYQRNGGDQIEGLELHDGTAISIMGTNAAHEVYGAFTDNSLTSAGISGQQNIVYGLEGDDSLQGASTDDILVGGVGADSYWGSEGDDTILFYRGDGADKLYNNDTDSITDDSIQFEVDIAHTQLWLTQSSDDLHISVIGTDDSITVSDWYASDSDKVNTIETSDGYTLNKADVDALLAEMAGMTAPTLGQTDLTAAEHQALRVALNDAWTPDATTEGTTADETINGTVGDDYVYGYAGHDALITSSGNDTLYGGDGNDAMNSTSGENLFYGEGGNDTITGGSGNDIAYGGDGNDQLRGLGGYDWLYGEGGNDTFVAGKDGDDILDGGEGTDQANYLYAGLTEGLDIDLTRTSGHVIKQGGVTDTLSSIEVFELSNLDDTFIGDYTAISANLRDGDDTAWLGGGADNVSGWNGNDEIHGGGGNDVLYGQAGNDDLYGDDGRDTLRGDGGDDNLYGGLGDDVLIAGLGNDTYDGGDGVDELFYNYGGLTTALIVDLSGISNLVSKENGTLTDTVEDVEIFTLTGHDDTFTGDETDTTVVAGDGDDMLYGGSGNEDIVGENGNDTIYGAGGNDSLKGGAGNDIIYGEAGTDTIFGHGGDDTLSGGAGYDVFVGGGGADTFVFDTDTLDARDLIHDFNTGDGDALDISALVTNYTAGTDDIDDFVTLGSEGSSTVVSVDQDGTGMAFGFTELTVLLNTNITGHLIDDLINDGNIIV
ncbi:MAG: calcium-binding protein [Cyclobacteriaceae bacterium]